MVDIHVMLSWYVRGSSRSRHRAHSLCPLCIATSRYTHRKRHSLRDRPRIADVGRCSALAGGLLRELALLLLALQPFPQLPVVDRVRALGHQAVPRLLGLLPPVGEEVALVNGCGEGALHYGGLVGWVGGKAKKGGRKCCRLRTGVSDRPSE
ncbi:hypothetical protein CALCODRAFT_289522 [Calocera cornea HHB12733]|uniref:Uncharacterized protein n=1 Tax=Calocera cornea HHB12733 TaxID=1353952 RepID=A0A165FWF8_9BASI|nr:hypothetical protein CALCODRAFT_289522 [Calocera cornea HHB12733]